MKKPLELFFFFHINDTKKFKAVLKEYIHPLVTTTTQLVSPPVQQPLALLNIAFSQSGLKTLNVLDNLNDPAYVAGQYDDAKPLGDPGTTNWVKGFTGTDTHGVFLIASDKDAYITTQLQQLLTWLGASITERHRLMGSARPGSQAGHERKSRRSQGFFSPSFHLLTASSQTSAFSMAYPSRPWLGSRQAFFPGNRLSFPERSFSMSLVIPRRAPSGRRMAPSWRSASFSNSSQNSTSIYLKTR